MKKLLLIIGLAFSLLNTQAATATATLAASTNTAILTSPFLMRGITLYSTNAANSTVYIYDGYYNKTNAAYTNYTVSVTSAVTTYITTTGITNTMTNTVYKTTANPVAASTAVATPIITILVPPGPTPVAFTEPIIFGSRLTLSNSSAGTTYFIDYRTP